MRGSYWKGALLLFAALVLCTSAAIAAKGIDWAALNPGFAGAGLVKDPGVCAGCHEDAVKSYEATAHGLAFAYGPKGELQAGNCEACHGPRSKHADSPDNGLVIGKEQESGICLQCHQGGNRIYWQNGLHSAAGLTCASCHTVMEKKSEKGLLSKATESDVCYSCHANVRGEMQKTHHHPVREGKVACSDCHQVHGTSNRGMLKGASVNETCYSCHQEKRGPFLWEHAPVRENCLTCHTPHGSNNADLLNAKGPAQCVTCHQYGGHINQFRYNRVSTPYSNGCVNCHMTVHGSNHPSGAKFNR
jgi:DmsE family decaheme c-type cytochrome